MTGHFANWRRFADRQIDSATVPDDDSELDFVLTTIPGDASEAEAIVLLQADIDRLPARRWPRWMWAAEGDNSPGG